MIDEWKVVLKQTTIVTYMVGERVTHATNLNVALELAESEYAQWSGGLLAIPAHLQCSQKGTPHSKRLLSRKSVESNCLGDRISSCVK